MDDLDGATDIRLELSQLWSRSRWSWIRSVAVGMFWCCVAMERSSAYESIKEFGVDGGMSRRNTLNRVGDRTAPWGTPFGSVRVMDDFG